MENTTSVNSKDITRYRKNMALLEDNCFYDVHPISRQLIKAQAMKSSRSAYISRTKDETHTSEQYYPEESIQHKTASEIANRIFKKMLRGKNAASEELRKFMIRNEISKLKILLTPEQSLDGGTGTLNKQDKSISVILTAGIFSQKESNEDILAGIIGHELGHFLADDANKKEKITNARETESFCDWFGHALTVSAGYTPKGIGEIYNKFASTLKPPAPDNPHPNLKDRAILAQMVAKSYHVEDKSPTPFSKEIQKLKWIPERHPTPVIKKQNER